MCVWEKGCFPIEIGSLNAIVPFWVACKVPQLKVIDMNPCARSLPHFVQSLLDLSKIPICPAAMRYCSVYMSIYVAVNDAHYVYNNNII